MGTEYPKVWLTDQENRTHSYGSDGLRDDLLKENTEASHGVDPDLARKTGAAT